MKKQATSTATSPRGRRPGTGRSGVDRILVGVRIEPRLVKVMKALAELQDCALGELIERVFWNAMDGQSAFAEKGKMTQEIRNQIQSLKSVYGVTYNISDLAKTKPARKSD